ncbi:MAG: diguanylate cyclase [Gammaproteobacteria bacterium]|nr:diguanylate cyclase [Gammaproteobacteria bacterium]
MADEILIVDDTPANIEVLRGMLEAEGYRISAAPSGAIALRIAPRLQPALILLDVMMPELSGLETCQRLRADAETRHIPVIFVTAKNDTGDIVEGFGAGANDYITKPFRREEVCARVKTHLSLYEHRRELQEQGERLRAIVNNIADGILIFDTEGRLRFLNPAGEHLLGYASQQLDGQTLQQLLDPEHPCLGGDALGDTWRASAHGSQEVRLRRADGGWLEADMAVNPAHGAEPLFVAVFRDARARKDAEEALRQLALTDALTQLGNRRHFDGRLAEELRRGQRHGEPLALLLADIDHFKAYNDHYGHQAGDRCLRDIAQIFQGFARRPGDLAARYGGEEFALLLPQTDRAGAEVLATSLVATVQARALPHAASPTGPHVSISLGLSIADAVDEGDAAALIGRADQALYAAKHAGRNRWQAG